MTLLLYARRKGWPLEEVEVELSHERMHARDCQECEEEGDSLLDVIRRYILVRGPLSEDQTQRLLEIAGRCPVSRTLVGGPRILDELDITD